MSHWPVIGHDWAVKQLQQAVARHELSHALLITGPESVGKRTLALTLAKSLLCTAEAPERPCGVCSACRRVDSGNHLDLLLVDPESAGKGVKIDQIRALERFLSLTPHTGQHKITLVSALEMMNPNAANALLKTLEEPPSYAHLILLASDADTLLPTIISRSQHFPLRTLPGATIQRALVKHWGVAEAEAQRLARLSGGRLGWAVQAITHPEHLRRAEESLQQLLNLLRSDLPTRFQTAQELAGDTVSLAQSLEYWRTGWRDVLLLQTDNAAAITYLEHRESLAEIATRAPLETTTTVLQSLSAAQKSLQRNANTRLLVETLLLDLPEIDW